MNNSIDTLLSDNVNGASVLSANLLTLLKEDNNADHIITYVNHMVESHPGMACFLNLKNALTKSDNPQYVVESFEKQWHQSVRTVIQSFKNQYKHFRGNIGVYSHSGTVKQCIEQLDTHSVTLHIPESRPSLEGIPMAEKLSVSGFKSICVMTDACFFSSINSLDLMVTGCDAISSHYFINKTGTAAIKDLCRIHRIPMVVLGDMTKQVSDEILKELVLKQGCPDEIYKGPSDFKTVNPYLERIDLSGIMVLV